MHSHIKIRYNTEKDKTDPTLPAWRVLVDGVERLAESVDIQAPCWTTKDEISAGLFKWHISCIGRPVWMGQTCKIERPQLPGVIWLTGLSAAGKTTIAKILSQKLKANGYGVEELDGDSIREIFPNTGFSKSERDQHVRRVGYLSSRLEAQGLVVICSLISPYEESRNFVRQICKNFFEVYVSTPLEVCEARDPKGLYKKVRGGEIKSFTGIDDPYEAPKKPEINIDTTKFSAEVAAEEILKKFLSL